MLIWDLELKKVEGTQQHGPGAILEGAIGSWDPTSLVDMRREAPVRAKDKRAR